MTLSTSHAETLIRLVRNEGEPISEVYGLDFPESPDGTPLGVTRTQQPGVHRMARLMLTSHEWHQLAVYTGNQLTEQTRRDLIDARPHTSWADVARTFIKALPKEHNND